MLIQHSEYLNSLIRNDNYAYFNEAKNVNKDATQTHKKLSYQANPLDDSQALQMWKRAKRVNNF